MPDTDPEKEMSLTERSNSGGDSEAEVESPKRRRLMRTTLAAASGASLAALAGCGTAEGAGQSGQDGGSEGESTATEASGGEGGTETETASGGSGGSSSQEGSLATVTNDGGTIKYNVADEEGVEVDTLNGNDDGRIESGERVAIHKDGVFIAPVAGDNPRALPGEVGNAVGNNSRGAVVTTAEAAQDASITGIDGVAGLDPGESVEMGKNGNINGAKSVPLTELASEIVSNASVARTESEGVDLGV